MTEAEQHVSKAIESLRQDMPGSFILVYITGQGEEERFALITHCNLHQAQRMLPFAMEQMSHQYAVGVAKNTIKETPK